MFRGSYVALITPMNLDGSIDYQGLENLAEFHISNGTDGIVAVGTTGESATVTLSEHVDIVKQVVKSVNGRVPVIAGNGANATARAIELTQALNNTDIDGMLGVTPYYNKPSPAGLLAHYSAVADATDIPQILYNVPGRTGVDMQPEVIAELSEHKNIVAVKEATGDVSRLRKIKALCDDNFAVLSGDDVTACEFILSGGDGAISVVNNIAPKAYKQMCDAALSGDKEAAYQFDELMSPLYSALFVEANPIPVKWAAHKMRLIKNNTIRLPLTELSGANYGLVKEAMEKAQLEVN